MSEVEKIRRDRYQKKRKRLILIQAIIIGLLTFATVITSVTFIKNKRNAYVSYTEEGRVVYRAYLADNNFYEEEYLNGSHAYVASLIDRMTADFSYDLEMQIDDVEYRYSYSIDARLVVKDKSSKTKIYDSFHEVLHEETAQGSGSNLHVRRLVEFDYQKFDRMARDFNSAYGLKNTENTLIVTMNINVIGMSESFAESNSDAYTVSLSLPLMESVVSPQVSATVPTGEQRIVVKDIDAYGGIKIAAIILGGTDILAAVILAFYIFLSIDKHIDYARKVRKLISNYESYIQKILDPFDFSGYQVLRLSSFKGLLEIRDTVQSPVLMYENDDRTHARFFIVNSANVVYMYEITVEDNTEGVSNAELIATLDGDGDVTAVDGEPEITASVEEPEVTAEALEITDSAEVEEHEVTAPAEEPEVTDTSESEIEDNKVEDENVEGGEVSAVAAAENVAYVTYKRSYISRLIQADDELKERYTTVKREMLSYKKVKSRISWGAESFGVGRIKVAKLTVRGKILWLNLNLSPSDYAGSKYPVFDSSEQKKFADVPLALRIKSNRSLKYALELIGDVMDGHGIARADEAPEVAPLPYEDTRTLIEKGYIKEFYKGQKDENAEVQRVDISEMLNKK